MSRIFVLLVSFVSVGVSVSALAAGGQPADAPQASAAPGGVVHSEPLVRKAVLETYADIAAAAYVDALAQARVLNQRIIDLLVQPDAERLRAARQAWLTARIPYQQTEVYRFGNSIVDEWEGKVNAWPIDEGFIDYVDAGSYGQSSGENPLYAVNIISSERVNIDGRPVDASVIDAALLSEVLQEAGGIETNVATGYHAVEFLLWGQDLNPDDNRMGAGQRPASDFSAKDCTGGHCARRADYLRAASALLVDDLAYMARAWMSGGQARARLNEDEIFTVMLTGIADLAYGELAGERIRTGLVLHDQEEEHDCFSDNTHNSHHYNVVGIENVYLGRYQRIDGSFVEGKSLSAVVAGVDPDLDRAMRNDLVRARAATQALVESAESGFPYDWLIDEDNPEGNDLVQAVIDRLAELNETASKISSALAK